MLLTDGNPNTNEELRAYESAILNVSKAESIDLDVKRALASEELAQEVLDFLLNRSAGADPRSESRRSMGVADVVVTRQMKRWHALQSLAVFYRDAFHNQLNDRYREKFFEYREGARRARAQTFAFGVGLVLQPLPAPGPPAVGFAAGPQDAATYYLRITWAGGDGRESAPGALTSFTTPPGGVPTVEGVNPPVGAAGFHVYAGLTPEVVTRQTETPVAVGEVYMLDGSGVVVGIAPGDGQTADVYLAGAAMLRRG